jgi:hypothetical protein
MFNSVKLTPDDANFACDKLTRIITEERNLYQPTLAKEPSVPHHSSFLNPKFLGRIFHRSNGKSERNLDSFNTIAHSPTAKTSSQILKPVEPIAKILTAAVKNIPETKSPDPLQSFCFGKLMLVREDVEDFCPQPQNILCDAAHCDQIGASRCVDLIINNDTVTFLVDTGSLLR